MIWQANNCELSIDNKDLYFHKPTIDEPSIDNKKLSDIKYHLKPNANNADKLVYYDSHKEPVIKLDKDNELKANIVLPITHYFFPDPWSLIRDIPNTSDSFYDDYFFLLHTAYNFHLDK
jgi:hypothetical protein